MHIPRRGAAESADRNGASLAAAGRHPLGRHRILASLSGARAARDATATTGPAQGRRQPEEVVGRLSWPPVSFQTKCETSPVGTSRQSRQRSTSVAFGAKWTLTEPHLQKPDF